MDQLLTRDIPGFPGYKIGDNGNVYSEWVCVQYGVYVQSGTWRQLKGGPDKDGYRKVILCNNGKRSYRRVHMLVLEAFIGPCPPGYVAAHDNGVRWDNRLSNLLWKTQQDNMADKLRHGTHQEGERHGCHILTDAEVIEIRQLLKSGERGVAIATEFGVSDSTISAIKTRRLWNHIPEQLAMAA